MYGSFLHANRVSTVPDAFLRPFKFLSGADGAEEIRKSKIVNHRNNPHCWLRMEMHAQYMHISVQLLVSWLDFILSTSLSLRSALFKCERWSLKRRVMTTYNAYLHMWWTIELSIDIRFNSSVEHLYIAYIFLRCLHRSKYEQQMMDNSCLCWWRVFSTYTACLHAWCMYKLGIHVRCGYGA